MSLLNKMLEDLEKRQATAGAEQSLPNNIFYSSPRRSYNGLLLLALAAAGAGIFVWMKYQKPGAQPPILQMAAEKSLPKVNPVPVPTTENESLSSAPASVTQAASEAVSKPSATPTGVQAAKPEVAAVRKDSASAQAATAPHGNAQVAGAQAATKPVTLALANEKATKDSAEVLKQAKPATTSPLDKESSFKVVKPAQRSNNLYKQAILLLQQSRTAEAQNVLKQAIGIDSSNHGARQLLAELLVDAGHNTEAATLLREGLEIAPGDGGFSLVLARLQVANGSMEEALSTMEQGQSSTGNDPEYQAFLAALLQNQGRHAEAIQHYISALRSNPSMPSWLIGVGISLQAENNMSDAAAAFQRAIDTGELSLEVAQFAELQLKQIRQQP